LPLEISRKINELNFRRGDTAGQILPGGANLAGCERSENLAEALMDTERRKEDFDRGDERQNAGERQRHFADDLAGPRMNAASFMFILLVLVRERRKVRKGHAQPRQIVGRAWRECT
jgi:hypothetical protein